MDVESWQGGGIWRKKKNSSNLERRKSPPSHRRNHKLCPEFWKDCWAASLGIFKSNVFKKIINKSCCQSTSLELRVKIRSKFSTNSLKVDSSMGLYCRHSRISKYLHRNRHQKEKKKKNVKLICPRLIWKKKAYTLSEQLTGFSKRWPTRRSWKSLGHRKISPRS